MLMGLWALLCVTRSLGSLQPWGLETLASVGKSQETPASPSLEAVCWGLQGHEKPAHVGPFLGFCFAFLHNLVLGWTWGFILLAFWSLASCLSPQSTQYHAFVNWDSSFWSLVQEYQIENNTENQHCDHQPSIV